MSILGEEGRIAHAWVNARGGLQVFAVFFHSEGWTPGDEASVEAVVQQAGTARHPCLTACDAIMNPEYTEKSLWFRGNVHVH